MFEERLALIIDTDLRSAKVAKEAWQFLCDDKVEIITSFKEVKKLVDSKRILFIILNLDIDLDESLAFVKNLRKNSDNPNYKVPILIITESAAEAKFAAARDAGMTELLLKPFNTKILKDMIISILRNPRNFIFAAGYVGPDRRKTNKMKGNGDKRKL
ncbi:MAG: hypothetical protein K0R98_1752 [Rickettsiaceae bacterium]|jgi:DNA-binding response OmpR family regulator|nr:hypothetical protein [Rickettsiaceae bacterium]